MAAHALVGNRLLLANRLDVLKAALDLRAGVGRSLATAAAYQAAKKAAGPAAAATAYVDLAVVKQNPAVQEALKHDNPLAALLLFGVTESLRDSRWLSLGLTVENGACCGCVPRSTARPRPATTSPRSPGRKQPRDGALPNLRVPRRIVAGSLYRDLHAFYAAKDNLFPERTSGLIFFENMMGIFFTGRDLTEEVLVGDPARDPLRRGPAAIRPGDRHSAGAVAGVRGRLPSPPSRAGRGNDRRGLAKSDRAGELHPRTKGRAGADPRSRVLRRHPLYRGPFLGGGREGQDRPAHALQYSAFASRGWATTWCSSSTEHLTRDVLDCAQGEMAGPRQPAAGVSSVIELDGRQLSSILEANHKVMVRQNMVEKGTTEEQAEAQVGLLALVPKYLGRAKLCLTCEDSRPAVTLELKLNPSGRAGE